MPPRFERADTRRERLRRRKLQWRAPEIRLGAALLVIGTLAFVAGIPILSLTFWIAAAITGAFALLAGLGGDAPPLLIAGSAISALAAAGIAALLVTGVT